MMDLKSQQVSMNFSEVLTIQTVEFSSQINVTNVGVALFEFETGEEMERSIVNDQGIATFDMVIPEKLYEVVVFRIDQKGEWMEQTREQIVFNPDHPTVQIETFNVSSIGKLNVPIVKQNPELPNGCEITSLTAILNYYGIDSNKMDLVNHYLPKEAVVNNGGKLVGPDPNIAYAGDPTKLNDGYYVYAPPIVEVANQVLFEHNSEYKAMDLTNASREEITGYVNSGVPVLTWVTIDLKKPRTSGYWAINGTNKKHHVYRNLHAVVMLGYKDDTVTVMNPLTGYEKIDADTFFESYKSLGSHAVVIL